LREGVFFLLKRKEDYVHFHPSKDKNHPLASLMEVLGVLVENYEKERPMATEKRPEG